MAQQRRDHQRAGHRADVSDQAIAQQDDDRALLGQGPCPRYVPMCSPVCPTARAYGEATSYSPGPYASWNVVISVSEVWCYQPGWNSIDSMIGAVSWMNSSKRSSGATTVIASVSTDMPLGRSTRYRRRRNPGSQPISWIQRLMSIIPTPQASPPGARATSIDTASTPPMRAATGAVVSKLGSAMSSCAIAAAPAGAESSGGPPFAAHHAS